MIYPYYPTSRLSGCALPFSIGMGMLSGLGFAPCHYRLLYIVTLGLWMQLIVQQTSAKCAATLGYAFGFGHYLASLSWIGWSFVVANRALLAPLGAIAPAFYLATYHALSAWICIKVCRAPMSRLLLLIAALSLSEWMRGTILLAFPWNLSGQIWPLEILQITSIIGIYGLSALTYFMIGTIVTYNKHLIAIGFFVFSGLWFFGAQRLQNTPTELSDVHVRLVQPSISQQDKWVPKLLAQQLDHLITLSQMPSEKPLHAIIWPEASVWIDIETNPMLRQYLSTAVPPQGILIFGGVRFVQDTQSIPLSFKFYVSVFALTNEGHIADLYDKSRLVPFGEYVPLKKLLRLKKLTQGMQDYSAGTGVKTLTVGNLPPFTPLICYEAIFPGDVTPQTGDRPEWLVNVSNDAWYGQSFGPYQHLETVRIRAIEEGIPLIRGANNGLSVVIDGCGRVLHKLRLNDVGIIDFELPKSLSNDTVFSRIKNSVFWAIITLIMLICGFVERSINQKNDDKRK